MKKHFTEIEHLSFLYITIFWFPLLLTWVMMAAEGPFVSSIIARMDNAKFNLAAFGVSHSISLVVESPIIMILSAAVALVKGKDSYIKMRNFTNILNILVTLVMFFVLIPVVFDFISQQMLNLPEEIAHLVYYSLILFIPWSPSIGYRRLYQGILIKHGKTKQVSICTVFRLSTMGLSAVLLSSFTNLNGAWTGAASLSLGVFAEAVMARIMAHKIVKNLVKSDDSATPLSYREISVFYYPLALTSFINMAIRPAVVFFIGQSRMAIESLAVLPVINGLMFIFSAVGLSFQEVAIAFISSKHSHRKKTINFGLLLGVISGFIYSLIVFTPLNQFWFKTMSGLSSDLAEFALLPAQLYIFMPIISVIQSLQRALIMEKKTTIQISIATALEVSSIAAVLYLLIFVFHATGASAASIAMTLGRIISIFYIFMLYFKNFAILKLKIEEAEK